MLYTIVYNLFYNLSNGDKTTNCYLSNNDEERG